MSRVESVCKARWMRRSEEHTSELQSRRELVCRLLLDTAPPDIYTLSLHDALPISQGLQFFQLDLFQLFDLAWILAVVRQVVMPQAHARHRRDATGAEQQQRDESG